MTLVVCPPMFRTHRRPGPFMSRAVYASDVPAYLRRSGVSASGSGVAGRKGPACGMGPAREASPMVITGSSSISRSRQP